MLTALGRTAVVLIVVFTTVLSSMLLVVSIWLTVAVPLVLLLVGVVAFARRS